MNGEVVAPSTRDNYTRVWCELLEFMSRDLGMSTLFPVAPSTVAMFLIHLQENGISVTTIKQKISAIAFIHKLHKLPDPCKDAVVANVVRAMARNFVPPEQKYPITVGLLECILEVLYLVVDDVYDMHLYAAIFITLYEACLRVGECVLASEKNDKALRRGQIVFHDIARDTLMPKSYALHFKDFKHRHGRRVPPVLVRAWVNRRYCPVQLLHKAAVLRHTATDYLFVHKDGRPVRASSVANVLAQALQKLKLDHTKYSPQCFRSGKCTDIVAQGRQTSSVCAVGRWRSSAYEAYNRPAYVLA